jgi:hypothetical protein
MLEDGDELVNLRKTSIERVMGIFERDSLSWGLNLHEALIIAAIPIIIMLGMVAIVPVPGLFVWITAEDSVIEWLQFFLIFASSLIFARISWRLFQDRQMRMGVLCLMIALGTFFVAGEEIAWGQHIFGWSTPVTLEAVNVQQEITLHNISSAHAIFVYGVMFAGLYGTLLPLFKAIWWDKQQSLLSSLLMPPLCLVPAFFMPFGYRFSRLVLGVDSLFPHLIFQITKFSEVTELCLYFGLVVFAWLNLRQIQVVQSSRVEAPSL